MPHNKFEIPPSRPDDEPLVCIQVNDDWIGWLIGMIYPYRYPENWGGTLEENRQARRDVMRLLEILIEARDCDMAGNCCVDVQILNRINVTTGRVEISIDNGQTWQPSPNDPIHNIIEQPPPVTSGVSATKCDAATNGLSHVEDWIAHVSNDFDTAVTFLEFAALVCAAILEAVLLFLTGPAGLAAAAEILAIIAGALIAVWNGGKQLFVDYWTQDNKDKVLCALYCFIGEDGSFTDETYLQMYARLQADLPASLAKTLFLGFFQSIGRQGVNNMCSYGDAANSDCAGCACDCDFSTWTAQTGTLVSQNHNQIVVTAVQVGATWYAGIKSANVNVCCCNVDFTVAGTDPAVIGYVPCGLANNDESNELFAYTGQSANRFDFSAPGAFTLTIFSTGDCP